jgi:hypothetical protein
MVFRFPFFSDRFERRIFGTRVVRFPKKLQNVGHWIHPWLGKLLFVGSFVNVYTGMQLLQVESEFEVIYWTCLACLAAFVGLQEGQRIYKRIKLKWTKVKSFPPEKEEGPEKELTSR